MITFLLVLILVTVRPMICQQCNERGLRRLDSTFARLLTLGGSGRQFPENKQDQLKKYCNDSFTYIQFIDRYKTKCMRDMAKQMVAVLVHSVKSVINKYCKRDSKALTDLIASTDCPNRGKKVADKCYTKLVDTYQGAINAQEKLRIPHVCCSYYEFLSCLLLASNQVRECNEFKLNTITNFVKEIFDPPVTLVCGEWTEESDKCDTLGTPPKKKKGQKRTKSYVLPLIDVLSSIGNE